MNNPRSTVTDDQVPRELPEWSDETDDDWLPVGVRRGFRIRALSALLVALVVAAGAFWVGELTEKHHAASSTTASAGRATFGATAAGGGAVGAGTGTASSDVTAGTVSAVNGDVLTVTGTLGTKTVVEITAKTTVSRTGDGSAGGPKVGDAAVVTGTASVNGSVTATAVTLTAKGVTSLGRQFTGEPPTAG